jgi:hypothetical protein
MDENLTELENELQRLTPRRLAPRTLAALERDLGPAAESVAPAPRYPSATTLRSWKWISWSLAGAAALFAVAGVTWLARQPPVVPVAGPRTELAAQPVEPAPAKRPLVNRYEPVRASTVLYDLKEDGPAKLADETDVRQVRYRYVDTYTWKNPATNASLRWSVPRDEVRLVRASLD